MRWQGGFPPAPVSTNASAGQRAAPTRRVHRIEGPGQAAAAPDNFQIGLIFYQDKQFQIIDPLAVAGESSLRRSVSRTAAAAAPAALAIDPLALAGVQDGSGGANFRDSDSGREARRAAARAAPLSQSSVSILRLNPPSQSYTSILHLNLPSPSSISIFHLNPPSQSSISTKRGRLLQSTSAFSCS